MRAKALAARRYEFFWWANIIISLLIGGTMYAILNSDTFFSSVVRFLFGRGEGKALISENLFSAICLYGRDFVWAYAVVFAVAYCFRGSFPGIKKAFLITLGFEAVVEVLKILSIIPGAFDVWSIVAVLIGNVLAAVIILIHERALI
ncbi:MAG: hypothetical protein J5794_03360 [Lachnospiraceae bacterium]|nr:hypothetical protein [Lachnospiraceae bacterium]